MSESDLIAAYHAAESSWQGAAAIFISVVFAYLAAAYFVGKNLARSQVVIVTSLYSLFSLAMLGVQNDILRRMFRFTAEIATLNPESSLLGPGFDLRLASSGAIAFLLGGVLFGVYVAGLVFMFQVRRRVQSDS